MLRFGRGQGAATYSAKTVPAAAGRPEIRYNEAKGEPSYATLTAVNLGKGGTIAWSMISGSRLSGGKLVTAGGLVFSGEEDSHLNAHDAATARLLWRFQCGAGICGPLVTYAIEGKQYVAAAVGGASFTKASGFGTGDALVVFALAE